MSAHRGLSADRVQQIQTGIECLKDSNSDQNQLLEAICMLGDCQYSRTMRTYDATAAARCGAIPALIAVLQRGPSVRVLQYCSGPERGPLYPRFGFSFEIRGLQTLRTGLVATIRWLTWMSLYCLTMNNAKVKGLMEDHASELIELAKAHLDSYDEVYVQDIVRLNVGKMSFMRSAAPFIADLIERFMNIAKSSSSTDRDVDIATYPSFISSSFVSKGFISNRLNSEVS